MIMTIMKKLGALALLALGILVLPAHATPTVALTAPANGAKYLAPAASITRQRERLGHGAGHDRAGRVLRQRRADRHRHRESLQHQLDQRPRRELQPHRQGVDSTGAETTSAARSITVSATNTAPTASLSAPANGAKNLLPATITVTASATAPEVNDTVWEVISIY